MKYVVIDTETSGLFDFSKPADADGQPRLAELAMILLAENLSVESERDFLVKPVGWTIPPETTAINGLTQSYLEGKGVPIADVLNAYTAALDEGRAVVAFNAQFDTKVMRGELRRASISDRFEATPNICTMRASTDVCKIPSKRAGWKFPKLAEACKHFKIEQPGSHTAMGDARSCVEIFRKLVELGVVPEARVHYATNRPMPKETT